MFHYLKRVTLSLIEKVLIDAGYQERADRAFAWGGRLGQSAAHRRRSVGVAAALESGNLRDDYRPVGRGAGERFV